MKDYNKYIFRAKEMLMWIVMDVAISLGAGYIFFRSVEGMICTLPLVAVLIFLQMEYSVIKNKLAILDQFNSFIGALDASMSSSAKPLEQAYDDALNDMRFMYSENAIFIKELMIIQKTVSNNNAKTLEQEFYDMALRTHVKDVIDFAQVFKICKNKSAGAIADVIKTTSLLINDRAEVRAEIKAAVNGGKSEFYLMVMTPTAAILLFGNMLGDYMDTLYTTSFGSTMMAVAIICNVISYVYGKKVLSRYEEV